MRIANYTIFLQLSQFESSVSPPPSFRPIERLQNPSYVINKFIR